MRHLIWIVFLLGLVLRFIWLDSFPVGFTPDEASFGYDAYSLLKTGKDQWGEKSPLVFKSFGDYKSPLLGYLLVPFVALFDLSKVTVRLPNALLGSLSILVVYLLTKKIFEKLVSKNVSLYLSLVASFLVSFSSWHIMLSRGAFEANLTTFLMPLGVYLFLRGLENWKYLLLASLVFGLNLFSYHSAKVVTPLLVIFLYCFYRKEVKTIDLKKVVTSIFIFLVFVLTTLWTFTQGAGVRVSERSIYNGALDEAAVKRIALVNKGTSDILARALHNKYQVTIKRFVHNYLQYVSPRFLFTDGPKETTYGMLPGRGVLYWFETILVVGFGFCLVNKQLRQCLMPLVVWFLLSPVPAALSTGVGYSANRAVIMIPAIYLLLTFGAFKVYLFMTKCFTKKLNYFFVVSFGLLVCANVISFVDDYFIGSPVKAGRGMLYGNLEVAYWLKDNLRNSSVIVSRRLSEPQIYLAFASKMEPLVFQEAAKGWNLEKAKVNWVDQIPEYGLDQYSFKNIEFLTDKTLNGNFLVGKPDEFPAGVKPDKMFMYPDGVASIYVVNLEKQMYAKNN